MGEDEEPSRAAVPYKWLGTRALQGGGKSRWDCIKVLKSGGGALCSVVRELLNNFSD